MLSKKLQQSVCNIVVVAFNKAKVKRYIDMTVVFRTVRICNR